MGKQIDKVVNKVRTSTIEDCENCDEGNCDIRHCLISGPHEDNSSPTDLLLLAAMEIITDFDTYGEVIQAGEGGEYGPDTSIERLRKAIEDYKESVR